MRSDRTTFKTVALEDGTFAVVQTDLSKPRLLEVVAIFYDAARARNYADRENGQFAELPIAPSPPPPVEPTSTTEDEIKEMNGVGADLTKRQIAVIETLRANADEEHLVEMKAAELAEAANIPLGSVHSIIQSLEKKKYILTTRAGSAHSPAVYQVL